MKWFRFYDDLLNDPTVQRLPSKDFQRKLFACLQGEENEFSRFVRPGTDRLSADKWRPLRDAVFIRDDYTCRYCGQRGGRLECDHVVPVSRGGSNEMENLATACFSCNRSKRAKLVEEWL